MSSKRTSIGTEAATSGSREQRLELATKYNKEKKALSEFLLKHKVEKGGEFTHTSLKDPIGSFYIPSESLDIFHQLYTNAVNVNVNVHITEKHRDICPIIIDLDFRQQDISRRYTEDHVRSVLYEIMKVVDESIQDKADISIYVLEKPPRQVGKEFKDGLHIVIPEIVTCPKFQYFLRDATMKNIAIALMDCGYTNKPEDMYDKAVIEKNNWLMYGSNKPDDGDKKWTVTHIYEWKQNSSIDDIPFEDDNELFIEMLSIRNKYESTKLSIEIPEVIRDTQSEISTTATASVPNSVDYKFITELVNILGEPRYSNYQEWIRVGWCLHNIDQSDRMLEIWKNFSKKSSKYCDGECAGEWRKMRNQGLGLGSLCKWAKEDNPTVFQDICRQSISRMIYQSVDGAHTDIARVLHRLYMDNYVCSSIKRQQWYEFVGHRWIDIENAYTLRQRMSGEVSDIYKGKSKQMEQMSREKGDKIDISSRKLGLLSQKLKTTSLKDNLIKECAEMFYDPEFGNKLDANKKLIGFNNGVYDLKTHMFRDGRPSDYVTMTTGYDFNTVDDVEIQNEIIEFITSIMSNDEMISYLLKVCAYMLDGDKYLEQFWFFTGRGRNGKGTLCMLLRKCLGNYYYEPDITIVTTLKKNSSGHNDELIRAKGKRVMVCSEPADEDKDSKFKVNKLKQMRGNDLLQARGLYQGFVEFAPQFGMIFQMNDMPQLSKVDDAVSQSLKAIGFPYQFVDNPTEDYQRSANATLKGKFETDIKYWQQFMRILLKVHKEYIDGNKYLHEPSNVTEFTREYLVANNPLTEWLRSNFDVTNNSSDRIKVDDMYNMFYPRSQTIKKIDFGKYMGLLGYKSKCSHGVRYYIGLRKKDLIVEDN